MRGTIWPNRNFLDFLSNRLLTATLSLDMVIGSVVWSNIVIDTEIVNNGTESHTTCDIQNYNRCVCVYIYIYIYICKELAQMHSATALRPPGSIVLTFLFSPFRFYSPDETQDVSYRAVLVATRLQEIIVQVTTSRISCSLTITSDVFIFV
jgi:hypothetical protein